MYLQMTKWVDKVSRRGELTWAINFIAKTLRVHPPKQLSRIMIMHFRSFKHSNFQNFQRGLRSILHLCFPSTFVREAARPFSFYYSFSKLIFIKCSLLHSTKLNAIAKLFSFSRFKTILNLTFKKSFFRCKFSFLSKHCYLWKCTRLRQFKSLSLIQQMIYNLSNSFKLQ
jgi:hypothetical protein